MKINCNLSMKKFKIILLILCYLHSAQSQSGSLTLVVVNPILTANYQTIFLNGNLNEDYNDAIFEQVLVCRSGNLAIIQNNGINGLVLNYSGIQALSRSQIQVYQSPNLQPVPQIQVQEDNTLKISFNCSSKISNSNYYNKFDFVIRNWRFSFLVDCDPNVRHKSFQFGYLLISIINAIIIIGVAMHSRVWSIRIGNRALRIQLRWERFVVILTILVILAAIIFFSVPQFYEAFIVLKYAGIFMAFFFVFICFNQTFYLVPILKKQIFRSIRLCEILSLSVAIGITLLAIFQQNWIIFNFLAGFICVGSIKLFHFSSLRQAYLSMGIMVVTVTTVAIILHFTLTRSYNDEATQLSSALFLQVPDLTHNLFKKCSWLPVFDVIIPGVLLSFLRIYDSNQGAKYIGVYTVVGNITFISSTALWILIQALYPFSVPFSLVTYLFLALSIFLISWRRNEWKTLFNGTFEMIDDQSLDGAALEERGQAFQKLLPQEAINCILKRTVEEDGDNQK